MQSASRIGGARSRRADPEFQMPLPRFHPAVYQSPTSSSSPSTSTSPRGSRASGSLKAPASPRQQSRQYSEATRKLIEYQQEMMRSTGAAGPGSALPHLPHTPSLAPCGSPGPATPLMLEEQPKDYLAAGAIRRNMHGEVGSQHELIESILREGHDRRQGGLQPGPSSPPLSPAPAS